MDRPGFLRSARLDLNTTIIAGMQVNPNVTLRPCRHDPAVFFESRDFGPWSMRRQSWTPPIRRRDADFPAPRPGPGAPVIGLVGQGRPEAQSYVSIMPRPGASVARVLNNSSLVSAAQKNGDAKYRDFCAEFLEYLKIVILGRRPFLKGARKGLVETQQSAHIALYRYVSTRSRPGAPWSRRHRRNGGPGTGIESEPWRLPDPAERRGRDRQVFQP